MLNFNVQHFMSIELELSTYINNNNPLSRFPKNPEICLKWKQFCSLNGLPGFTKEALDAIKQRTQDTKKPVIVNFVIDEMSIREQVIYSEGKFHGGIDFGTLDNNNDDNDCIEATKNVLVFMAVSLNDNWKVPIAYFFINSLNGKKRCNLLIQALEMLHDINTHVFSVTFDGEGGHRQI